MGFSWAGDLSGASPVKREFVVGANVYQGQIVCADVSLSTGGEVTACPVAASALPDATSKIMGICAAPMQMG